MCAVAGVESLSVSVADTGSGWPLANLQAQALALLLYCAWLQTDDAINILAECSGAVKSDVREMLCMPGEPLVRYAGKG